jgi:hypothetical protein
LARLEEREPAEAREVREEGRAVLAAEPGREEGSGVAAAALTKSSSDEAEDSS